MQTEDGGLWVVDDGRAQHGAIDASVRDREDTAFEVAHLDLAIAGGFRVAQDITFNFGKALLVAITQHRHHEALIGTHGDADVVVVLGDDFVTLDTCVDLWDGLQRMRDRLRKEGHEAKLQTMALDEFFLMLLAKLHDGAHINFIKSREHSGLLSSCDETLSNLSTKR